MVYLLPISSCQRFIKLNPMEVFVLNRFNMYREVHQYLRVARVRSSIVILHDENTLNTQMKMVNHTVKHKQQTYYPANAQAQHHSPHQKLIPTNTMKVHTRLLVMNAGAIQTIIAIDPFYVSDASDILFEAEPH